jgi:hypothetical protein
MMWSTHSRRIDPISRSAKPFCQGEAGAVVTQIGLKTIWSKSHFDLKTRSPSEVSSHTLRAMVSLNSIEAVFLNTAYYAPNSICPLAGRIPIVRLAVAMSRRIGSFRFDFLDDVSYFFLPEPNVGCQPAAAPF